MALMTWTNDPLFSGLEKAMDRAFDRAIGSRELGAFLPTFTGRNGGAGGHPMDIVETKDSYELHADAPGFTPADINVEMNEGVLTISGKRKEDKVDQQDGKVVRRERHFTSFTRSFTLPENVKDEGISASLDKGVLKVTVPKTEPAPKPEPKKIRVTAGSS